MIYDGVVIGEVWLRGDMVVDLYYCMFEEIEVSRYYDWFCFGDLVVVDDVGFVMIVDWVKDVIIIGGINVYGWEVEEVLCVYVVVV